MGVSDYIMDPSKGKGCRYACLRVSHQSNEEISTRLSLRKVSHSGSYSHQGGPFTLPFSASLLKMKVQPRITRHLRKVLTWKGPKQISRRKSSEETERMQIVVENFKNELLGAPLPVWCPSNFLLDWTYCILGL